MTAEEIEKHLPDCARGRHYSGTNDGGAMGDCMTCDVCGVSKYPEVFPGTIINQRSLADVSK